jgi:hypothetical protein
LTGTDGEGTLQRKFMARKLRVQYPGAIYHVMNRGDRREAIYEDDEDRSLFLETLGEACQKTDWQVHAWCLMSNHFHLVPGDRNWWMEAVVQEAQDSKGGLKESIVLELRGGGRVAL